jgi:hypothetical protein
MKNQKRFKDRLITDTEIETYCQGVDEILTKINNRCSPKKKKKRKDEDAMTLDEELMSALQ